MGNREDENEIRRKITLLSFRRYLKVTISDLGYLIILNGLLAILILPIGKKR